MWVVRSREGYASRERKTSAIRHLNLEAVRVKLRAVELPGDVQAKDLVAQDIFAVLEFCRHRDAVLTALEPDDVLSPRDSGASGII